MWSRLSLCLAEWFCPDLTAARRAEVADLHARRAAWRSGGEVSGEDRRFLTCLADWRALTCASFNWGSTAFFLGFGFLESWMVLKDSSAARLRAKLEQFRRMEAKDWD